jgi:hypothetical protein
MIGSATRQARAQPNEVCRKDRKDGLTVNRHLENPAQKMAFNADPFIAAPDARMSILAMGSAHETVYVDADCSEHHKILLANGAGHTFLFG